MDKTSDVFFEILLKNYHSIIMEAHRRKGMQNAMLNMRKSKDRTADAAIDNITGGRMTIDNNGNIIHLQDISLWASIISSAAEYYRSKKNQLCFKVFDVCYMQRKKNRDALHLLKISRPKLFGIKSEIKNLVRAAACEHGIWRAMSPRK